METPKPKPPVKPAAEQKTTKKDRKQPYVPKPHLTSRPFAQHEGLQNLQKQMENLQPRRRDNRKINPPAKRQR